MPYIAGKDGSTCSLLLLCLFKRRSKSPEARHDVARKFWASVIPENLDPKMISEATQSQYHSRPLYRGVKFLKTSLAEIFHLDAKIDEMKKSLKFSLALLESFLANVSKRVEFYTGATMISKDNF